MTEIGTGPSLALCNKDVTKTMCSRGFSLQNRGLKPVNTTNDNVKSSSVSFKSVIASY